MQSLSIGKFRGLQQCTSSRGVFTCLALDHRQNLRRALDPGQPHSVTDEELGNFKLEVTAELANLGTAVLLDPEFSAAQVIASRQLPGETGLVVAVEATGYGGKNTARQSQVLPDWSVGKARRMGASMVKLLVYFHPDSPTANETRKFVTKIAADCQHHDIALMLEPLSYSPVGNETLSSAEKRAVVIETARRLALPGVDVLKAEFPLDASEDHDPETWAQACAELSQACAIPWIVLSAAMDFETYIRQVQVACDAGASGAAAGRAIWQEAIELEGGQRRAFLQSTARERLSRLAASCENHGKPVFDFYSAQAPFDWYRTYPE